MGIIVTSYNAYNLNIVSCEVKYHITINIPPERHLIILTFEWDYKDMQLKYVLSQFSSSFTTRDT